MPQQGQDARRTGQERGRRRGGELRVARCGLARLQRAVLGHDLHECLEALDAVLELESREAVAVEPRLLGAVELLRGGTQAARSPHHLHLLCEERLLVRPGRQLCRLLEDEGMAGGGWERIERAARDKEQLLASHRT